MSATTTGSLDGRVAVVSGGCGGIGRAICARFAAEGAHVYAADVVEGDAPAPAGVSYAHCDVTSEDGATPM